MSLANPTALLWLLLVIPVVVFYILKIRLKRVPVSTVIFWRQIFDEKRTRSLWQRRRRHRHPCRFRQLLPALRLDVAMFIHFASRQLAVPARRKCRASRLTRLSPLPSSATLLVRTSSRRARWSRSAREVSHRSCPPWTGITEL